MTTTETMQEQRGRRRRRKNKNEDDAGRTRTETTQEERERRRRRNNGDGDDEGTTTETTETMKELLWQPIPGRRRLKTYSLIFLLTDVGGVVLSLFLDLELLTFISLLLFNGHDSQDRRGSK